MNSAWAMLVLVTAVKNTVMLSPKKMPGRTVRRHVAADGAARPVTWRRTTMTIHHSIDEASRRQNAIAGPDVSAHLTIDELLENVRTAPRTDAMPRRRGFLTTWVRESR